MDKPHILVVMSPDLDKPPAPDNPWYIAVGDGYVHIGAHTTETTEFETGATYKTFIETGPAYWAVMASGWAWPQRITSANEWQVQAAQSMVRAFADYTEARNEDKNFIEKWRYQIGRLFGKAGGDA